MDSLWKKGTVTVTINASGPVSSGSVSDPPYLHGSLTDDDP